MAAKWTATKFMAAKCRCIAAQWMATKFMAAKCTAVQMAVYTAVKWMAIYTAAKCITARCTAATAAKCITARCTADRCTAAKRGILDRFVTASADSDCGGETKVHKQPPSGIDARGRISYTPASRAFDPRQSAGAIRGPFSNTARLLSEPRHIIVNRWHAEPRGEPGNTFCTEFGGLYPPRFHTEIRHIDVNR
jgi:hypothetical protein